MKRRIDSGIDQETGECVRGCCEGDTSGTAHTSGPWRTHLSGSDGVYILPDTGDRREDVKHIAIVNGRDLQTDQRNARLIAAAPEMLKALQAILDLQPDDDGVRLVNPDFLDGARAAITKAEGRK